MADHYFICAPFGSFLFSVSVPSYLSIDLGDAPFAGSHFSWPYRETIPAGDDHELNLSIYLFDSCFPLLLFWISFFIAPLGWLVA